MASQVRSLAKSALHSDSTPPTLPSFISPARIALLRKLSDRLASELVEMGLGTRIGYDRTNQIRGSCAIEREPDHGHGGCNQDSLHSRGSAGHA